MTSGLDALDRQGKGHAAAAVCAGMMQNRRPRAPGSFSAHHQRTAARCAAQAWPPPVVARPRGACWLKRHRPPKVWGTRRWGKQARGTARQTRQHPPPGAGRGPVLPPWLSECLSCCCILAALFLPASPVSVSPASLAGSAAATAESETAAARGGGRFSDAGRRWPLGRKLCRHRGCSSAKRNTLERWAEVSRQVRPPLGGLLTRDLVGNEYVPAPPEGFRLIKFRSTYADGTAQTERLSLSWDDGTVEGGRGGI